MSASALASLDRTIGAVEAEMTALTGVSSIVPHPDPAAGRYMFADGTPRLDAIEAMAVAKSKQRGWDGKLRSVDHWRGWLMGQYRLQHDKWFSVPTADDIAREIASLCDERDRLPLSIGNHSNLKARTAELNERIAALRADLSRLSPSFAIAAE